MRDQGTQGRKYSKQGSGAEMEGVETTNRPAERLKLPAVDFGEEKMEEFSSTNQNGGQTPSRRRLRQS